MSGKPKQAPFEIVDIISVNPQDTPRNDTVYQTMAGIANRILQMEGELKTPPE